MRQRSSQIECLQEGAGAPHNNNVTEKQVRLKILHAVVALEMHKGHLKWKVADVARKAKSSRALVYYHFGKTKSEILSNCIELIAADYFGLREDRLATLKSGKGLESLLQTREMFLENPALAVFYQKWRAEPLSLLGQKFIEIEKRYQAKIAEAFPSLRPNSVVTLHAIFHGLITAPFATTESIREGFELCGRYIQTCSK
ncbi:MAG: TetR/AcrR family transcriptional regulator [Bdellovibrionota bacterium]